MLFSLYSTILGGLIPTVVEGAFGTILIKKSNIPFISNQTQIESRVSIQQFNPIESKSSVETSVMIDM